MIGKNQNPDIGKDTQFKPGESGNLEGKPKGTLHLSTHIQNLLADEEFTPENLMIYGKPYKGAPMKALIAVAIEKATSGDQKWADWLGKYGYGSKMELTGAEGKDLIPESNPELAAQFATWLKEQK